MREGETDKSQIREFSWFKEGESASSREPRSNLRLNTARSTKHARQNQLQNPTAGGRKKKTLTELNIGFPIRSVFGYRFQIQSNLEKTVFGGDVAAEEAWVTSEARLGFSF